MIKFFKYLVLASVSVVIPLCAYAERNVTMSEAYTLRQYTVRPFGEIDQDEFFNKTDAQTIKLCTEAIGVAPKSHTFGGVYRIYSYSNRFKLFSNLIIENAELSICDIEDDLSEDYYEDDDFQWKYRISVKSKEEALSLLEDIVKTLNILDYGFKQIESKDVLKAYKTLIKYKNYYIKVECTALRINDRDYKVDIVCNLY